MYFVAIYDLSLEMYKSICDLNWYKCTPHLLLTYEFSTYTNTTPRKYFLQVVKEVYWNNLKEKILHRSFYSISVDESTDKIMEHQLIVYITYLTNGGRGQCLLQIKDGIAQCMYDLMRTLLV